VCWMVSGSLAQLELELEGHDRTFDISSSAGEDRKIPIETSKSQNAQA